MPGRPGRHHRSRFVVPIALLAVATLTLTVQAGNTPARARTGMVVSQSDIASEVGWQVMREGGNAIDGTIATPFALAVTHPTAGNIGGAASSSIAPPTARQAGPIRQVDGALSP